MSSVLIHPTANEQHYEIGTGVLKACLGPRMKYSCCLYPTGTETLGQAEVAMLEAYVEKAALRDGLSILDLGWVTGIPSAIESKSNVDFKMRVGIWSIVLCGGISELEDHRLLKFQNAKRVH